MPPSKEPRIVRNGLATYGSPFFDVTLGGVFLEERFSDPLVIGLQGGVYLGDIVRLALRAEMPSSDARDEASGTRSNTYSLYATDSESPKFLYGGSLGISLVNSSNFAFSPGIMLMRSDVGDYGTVLGASLPFEWVTSRGLRFGLEVSLGRAFGGTVHYECPLGGCPAEALEDTDRKAGRALGLRFAIGYGIGYTRPR
jgi:hypothetical protein